jgi:hypothetical protein
MGILAAAVDVDAVLLLGDNFYDRGIAEPLLFIYNRWSLNPEP